MRSAYGRADSAAVCARRSFAAATICMALVIFCVALTEAIRLRKSFSEGMVSPVHICPGAANSREVLGVGINNRFEFCRGLVGEILRGANRIEETGVARAQEREEPVLEGPHTVNRKCIEVAIDPGIDHTNLFLHLHREGVREIPQRAIAHPVPRQPHEPQSAPLAEHLPSHLKGRIRENTTLAVIATEAALSKPQAKRLAVMASAGLSRAIYPVFSPLDGDIVFAASTGERELNDMVRDLAELGAVAANCLARAVARAVFEAKTLPFTGALPSWKDRFGR